MTQPAAGGAQLLHCTPTAAAELLFCCWCHFTRECSSLQAPITWVDRTPLGQPHGAFIMEGQQDAVVAVMAIFFHKSAAQPALAAEGLLAAVSGLVLSLDGLRLSIKPMAVKCVNLWNVVGHYAAELRHLPVLQSSQQRASNMQRRQQGLFDNQERKALL